MKRYMMRYMVDMMMIYNIYMLIYDMHYADATMKEYDIIYCHAITKRQEQE